jgi:hypothetical protein
LVEGNPVSSAELLFTFLANDQFALGSHDPLLEAFRARQSRQGEEAQNPADTDK